MSLNLGKSALSEALEESVKKDKNGFVGAVQAIADNLGHQLRSEVGKNFAQKWLLHTFANELLKYSIEDDRIRFDEKRKELADRLGRLLKNENWLTDDVISFLEAYREVATIRSFPASRAEVSVPVPGTPTGTCHFAGWLTKNADDYFQVSRKHVPFVSILEDSLADPNYVESVVDAFAVKLEVLRQEHSINWLCFVEKSVGPVGALGMLSALVAKLHLPACVFRAGYWSAQAKLVGSKPPKNAKVAMVYDLCVTGDGIKQVATEARLDFEVPIVAAVVLYNYGDQSSIITEDHHTVHVRSIASDALLQKEIEQFVERGVSTTHHIKLTNGRGSAAFSVGGEGLSLSKRKDIPMNPASEVAWKPDLGFYAEKKALKFLTPKALETAVHLLWKDRDFVGMPRGYADGSTLIVPSEAVELFRSKELPFEEFDVISSGELPPAEAHRLRLEQGTP